MIIKLATPFVIFITALFRLQQESEMSPKSPPGAPPKKKHKKEHKHKHKKHTVDKLDKSKKHKKHKKHKHKPKDETEDTKIEKNDRYTPDLSPKSTTAVCNTNTNHIINGKSLSGIPKSKDSVVKTNTDEVVNIITSGLTETHSLEIISSESDDNVQETECDSDAIDVSVIEADMDLEELMKQKELLQAEIAKAEIEGGKKNGNSSAAVDEVILLDDSSNDGDPAPIIKKTKTSHTKERRVVLERTKEIPKRKVIQGKNHKEHERTTNRDERNYRDHNKNSDLHTRKDILPSRRKSADRRSRERSSAHLGDRDAHRSRYDRDYQSRESRDRHRSNEKRYEASRDYNRRFDRDRDTNRRRNDERDRRGRDRHRGKGEKQDKFKDSLSEGMKHGVSSESEVDLDIDLVDDEEDEQKIIERRRKQREELLKVKRILLDISYLFFVSIINNRS